MTITNLSEWMGQKVGRRREFASNRALAEHVGVSEGTIRNIRRMCDGSGKYLPSLNTLMKIEEAFPSISLSELQRMAGLPVGPIPEGGDERVQQFANAAAKLTPENQEAVMAMIKFLLEQQKRSAKK